MWTVRAVSSNQKGERMTRDTQHATKREAHGYALQIQHPDKHHVARIVNVYVVEV